MPNTLFFAYIYISSSTPLRLNRTRDSRILWWEQSLTPISLEIPDTKEPPYLDAEPSNNQLLSEQFKLNYKMLHLRQIEVKSQTYETQVLQSVEIRNFIKSQVQLDRWSWLKLIWFEMFPIFYPVRKDLHFTLKMFHTRHLPTQY